MKLCQWRGNNDYGSFSGTYWEQLPKMRRGSIIKLLTYTYWDTRGQKLQKWPLIKLRWAAWPYIVKNTFCGYGLMLEAAVRWFCKFIHDCCTTNLLLGGTIPLETNMGRNELSWIHDIVGIQDCFYFFHCPQCFHSEFFFKILHKVPFQSETHNYKIYGILHLKLKYHQEP